MTDTFDRARPVPDNLVGDLHGVNAFSGDRIAAGVIDTHAPWARERATGLGERVWDPHVLKLARDAERNGPELRTLDRLGNERFDVDFESIIDFARLR